MKIRFQNRRVKDSHIRDKMEYQCDRFYVTVSDLFTGQHQEIYLAMFEHVTSCEHVRVIDH